MANAVLPYPDMDFTPLDILTAAEMDQLVANDQYLANFVNGLADGSNLSDGVIQARKIDFDTVKSVDFGLLSGWTSNASDPLTVERWGKFVFIRGRVDYSGNIPVSDTQIGVIPEGFRPATELFETVMGASGALTRVIIQTGGRFSTNVLPGYTTNYIKFNDLYLAA